MKPYTLFLLTCLLLFGKLKAQEVNTAKLDSFFNALSANNKGMGSFAVSKDGKVVYQRSLGYSLIEGDQKTAATEYTTYRIGSVTKTFTATLIFQLIEQGKLSLETKLSEFFPEMPNAAIINIGNLLNHTSGLKDYVNDAKDPTWITKPHAKAELLDTIANGKVHFAPGVNQRYCNSGFLLLGYILEKITGKTYPQLINERIFKKLNMRHSISGLPNNTGPLEARAYIPLGNGYTAVNDIYFPNVIAVGDVLATPTDLLIFFEALMNGKLVNVKSLDQMHTFKEKSAFGMGLIKVPFYDMIGFGHTGGTYGSHSVLFGFEQGKVALASCVNSLNYPINDISIAILSIVYGKPFEIPSFKALVLNSEELDKYTGLYSNKDLPIKITVSKKGSILFAQATGQSEFPLEASGKGVFKFDPAGIVIEFNPDRQEMLMKQKGGSFLFKKDKI
jgi:D-alanyl-D-alanine carboxypeptidase